MRKKETRPSGPDKTKGGQANPQVDAVERSPDGHTNTRIGTAARPEQTEIGSSRRPMTVKCIRQNIRSERQKQMQKKDM